jgi:hypothetical protein
MNGKFEIFLGQDKQYYFRLLSPSNVNLGYSEGYTAKNSAVVGISSVKANSTVLSNFTAFKANDQFYYFILKAANGETILRSSRKYSTMEDAKAAAIQVSKLAPTAVVVDTTPSKDKVY